MRVTQPSTETNWAARIGALSVAATVTLAVIGLFLTAGVAAAAGPQDGSLAGMNGSVTQADETNLTVLQYNDIQTAMADNESVGTLVGAINDRKRALDSPTVVVGGGDEVSPSSLSAVSQWEVPVDVLNVLDPAAEVVGNHDLDYGFEAVPAFSNASEFPWLVANIVAEDGGSVPGTQNYTVVERGGVEIGLLGLVDDAIDPKTEVDFAAEGYRVTDWSTAGGEVATTLRTEENVDVVIALTHTGISESREIANNTDNIDVIVSGDDEVLYEPQVTSGTVIVEAGGEATHLGEVNLSVGEGTTEFTGGTLYDLEAGNWSTNESASSAVEAGRTDDLGTVAGETTAPLDSTFGNYADDTGWGRTIGDAFLAQTGADVAMTNAGGIRGNFVIDAGEVTYDDIYTSLPFGNTLVTKAMTGEQIRAYLERTASSFDSDFGVQAELQVAGLTYELVDRPDPERKVTDIHVQGEPIDPGETYEVTVNSFMAGDSFFTDLETVEEDLTLYGTAVVEYVEQQGTLTPPQEDRIRRTTRTLGDPDITLDDGTARFEYDVPDAVDSVQADSFTVLNETSGTVPVENVEFTGDSLRLSANQTTLVALTERSDIVQLYGTYSDSAIDSNRNGFDSSRLNADITLSESDVRALQETDNETDDGAGDGGTGDGSTGDDGAGGDSDPADEESGADDGSSPDDNDDSTVSNDSGEDADSDGPGFTVVIAVVALLGAALLAARRRE